MVGGEGGGGASTNEIPLLLSSLYLSNDGGDGILPIYWSGPLWVFRFSDSSDKTSIS